VPDSYLDIDRDGQRDPNEPEGILPNTRYLIRIDYTTGPLEGYFPTIPETGGEIRDSNGIRVGDRYVVAEVLTGNPGDNDHTYDFGFNNTNATETPPDDDDDDGSGFGPTPTATQPNDLVLDKDVDPPFAMPGDEVTWTIRLTNNTGQATNRLQVEDDMPDELEILRVETSSGAARFEGQFITFEQETLAPGASVDIRVTALVREAVQLPFIVENVAVLINPPRTASATLASVSELPATGESPWDTIRPVALVILLVAGALFLVRRLAGRKPQG
jgi:uncharacterized repeat protein (TIGR01451 family)